MLTVWCVWWRDPAAPDKYNEYCVQRLQRTVRENLDLPHRFVCVTTETVEGVETVAPPVDWPGWWGKLAVPGLGSESNLYLDLDVVVTGSLDVLMPFTTGPLAMPWNWAQSGHGGCQSSVMAWGGQIDLTQDFHEDLIHWPPKPPWQFYGDQEFITWLRDCRVLEVVEIPEQYVKSYKYHCRDGLPEDCRVAVFHGEPKPQSVKASWFQW